MTDDEEIFLYDDYEDVNIKYSEKPVGGVKMEKKDKPTGKRGEDRAEREKVESKEIKKEKKRSEQKKIEKEIKKDEEKEEIEKKEERREQKEPEEELKVKKFNKFWVYTTAILVLVIIVVAMLYFKGVFNIKKPEAAAIVNGETITLEELNGQYDRLPEQYKQVITKNEILDRLIDERILLKESAESFLF